MKKILPFLILILAFNPLIGADWTTNYQAALAQAKAQNKLVLLDFTGSDWCPPCQLLDKEVFSTSSFKDFAGRNFITVTIDFPVNKKLPPALTRQNDQLQQQFKIVGNPTLIVVDANGKERGRILGYDHGSGPDVVIKKLQNYLQK